MIKITNKQTIAVQHWDQLVVSTYGRPYSFQQQDGCQERGNFEIEIPSLYDCDDFELDWIPDTINGEVMGVSFAAWLARDPMEWSGKSISYIHMFWHRNFYPDIQMVANDLHSKGLIPAGNYDIEIDW